jgi:hypothetical protein
MGLEYLDEKRRGTRGAPAERRMKRRERGNSKEGAVFERERSEMREKKRREI